MEQWIAKTTLWLTLVVSASAFTLSTVAAQERSQDEVSRITRQVSQEVYSPYCPGKTLAMCPSANASFARQDIQQMAREGMNAEEIRQVMVDRYGDEYALIEPSSQDQMWLMGSIISGLVLAVLAVLLMVGRRFNSGDEEDDVFDGADRKGTDGELDDDDPLLADLRAEYRD